MKYIDRNYPEFKNLFNRNRTFHAVMCDGEGSVSIMIRKNTAVWLYRFFRFGECSRFVHDSAGKPLVFNKMPMVANVLLRKQKVHAQYNLKYGKDGYAIRVGGSKHNPYYAHEEWSPEEYNKAWFVGMYSTETTTEKALLKDPYHWWVKGYKAHFTLEKPFEKRRHYAYWRPID